LVAQAVGALRVGRPGQDLRQVDVGPLNNERQLEIVEAHVQDAVAKGARVLCGGKRTGQGLWFEPTVLDHCTHEMKAVTDETFGPVLPLLRVKDAEEAVRWANDSRYGLNASVWSEDIPKAQAIARRLEAGTLFVNNHALTGAMPFAPWTGVKETGYGVADSVFALHNYVRPRTLLTDRNSKPDPWWFPKDDVLKDIAERLAKAQLGQYTAALKVPGLMKKRVKSILALARGR
jgi:succinate-semialdehyde dehydrogenase/glutarate-semialdehyde dehydrogenase